MVDLIDLMEFAESLTESWSQPPIQFFPEACVRAVNKNLDCTLCTEACPTAGLQLNNNSIVLNQEQCIACGLCLHRCPTGAFVGSDGMRNLLTFISNMPEPGVLELACPCVEKPGKTRGDVDAVLATGRCLVAFGPSALLGLLVLGMPQVRMRLDACATCMVGSLQTEIEASIRTSQAILTALGQQQRLQAVVDSPDRTANRPIHDANRPNMSRRNFFMSLRGATPQEQPGALLIDAEKHKPAEPSSIPWERSRLLSALAQLALMATDTPLPQDTGFVQLVVNDACSACQVCSRSCPTGAIEIAHTPTRYTFRFQSSLCTQCGLCSSLCPDDALQFAPIEHLDGLLTTEPSTIREGDLTPCTNCSALVASATGETLCPTCKRIANQPHHLGSRLRLG